MSARIAVDANAVEEVACNLEFLARGETLGGIHSQIDSVISQSEGLFPSEVLKFNESLHGLTDSMRSLYENTALLLRNVNELFKDTEVKISRQFHE